MQGGDGLLIEGFDGDRDDVLVAGGLKEGLGVGSIGLVSLAVAGHMGGRKQGDLVAEALELRQPAFTMHITSIAEGSPAAATGQLQKGQIMGSPARVRPILTTRRAGVKADSRTGTERLIVLAETRSKDTAERYFVSFRVEELIQTKPVQSHSVGIDLGLQDLVVLSTGEKIGYGLGDTAANLVWGTIIFFLSIL